MVIADLAITFEDHSAGARHSSLQLSHDYKTLKYQRSWQNWSTRGGGCRLQPSSMARWARCSPAISRPILKSSSCLRPRLVSWTFSCLATAFVPATAFGAGTAGSTGSDSIVEPPCEHRMGLGGLRDTHPSRWHDGKLVFISDRALPM
ncbi:unnamed protein product [Peronospora farinosa]|uniref:Uncharacterized protein n=1 Tax=Peronospora farinosa TaxID=134698 RepID=A0AAV0T6P3_9STRA|nr:unnamed protein product [Peronospora farinosa]